MKKLNESNKFFKNEYEELVNAYVEVLMAEKLTVYPSTKYYQQSGYYKVEAIWRTENEAIEFLEEVCDDSDCDYIRKYKDTKLAQPLTNFKLQTIKDLAKRELEDNKQREL